MYALTNCDVFTGLDFEHEKAILVERSEIQGLVSLKEVPGDIEVHDLQGQTVAPGFIDVQVNGGGGKLFNDSPDLDTVRTIVSAHRRFGTTNMLPTFITGSTEGMQRAAATVRDCLERKEPGVLGIHFEGPFILPEKAGVHDKRYIRPVRDAEMETVCSLRNGITLLTLAPEQVSTNQIASLRDRGILVALGHTNATYAEAMAAFEAGATCTTHLYNAMSPLTSRSPGVVGAALDHDDSWAGIIVDGFHAEIPSVRIAIHAKAVRKMFLVTDAMPPVGNGEGFRLGEYDIVVESGRCVTGDGILAGSALDMATAVRNLIQKVGLPKPEALRMASTYPAEFLGLADQLGQIAPGFRANLAIFNNQIQVSAVIVEGVYEAFR